MHTNTMRTPGLEPGWVAPPAPKGAAHPINVHALEGSDRPAVQGNAPKCIVTTTVTTTTFRPNARDTSVAIAALQTELDRLRGELARCLPALEAARFTDGQRRGLIGARPDETLDAAIVRVMDERNALREAIR